MHCTTDVHYVYQSFTVLQMVARSQDICIPYRKSGKELLRFMPKFLVDKYQKDQEMKDKLRSTFDRFNAIEGTAEHLKTKYMEVYEKDKMCGRHIYRLSTVSVSGSNNRTQGSTFIH